MTINEQTLQELARQFGLALDWGNENFIPYLKELAIRVVDYENSQSILWLVIGIALIIFGIIIVFLELRYVIDGDGFFIVVGAISLIVGVIMVCFQVNDLLLCKYLPEKIILRYIKSD